jgi:LPXTG-motif cell wall-anchored protein
MFDFLGNSTVDPTSSPDSTGLLGSLGSFANQVAPLVGAIKGTSANPTAKTVTATPTVGVSAFSPASFTSTTWLLIGGGLLAVVGLIFFLRRK